MAVEWSYFERFDNLSFKYLPDIGEGDTMATQIVTAVNKLVYKWYNDGDVFDNTYALEGWWNDLSSYANWLDKNTEAGPILRRIEECETEGDYEDLLEELADFLLCEGYLEQMDQKAKTGSIYHCEGAFKIETSSKQRNTPKGIKTQTTPKSGQKHFTN